MNLDNDLYILLFIKLNDYKYIYPLNENNKESNLMEIKLKDIKNNIVINIKYIEEEGEIQEIKKNDLKNDLNIINIPYKLFKIKETNNILVKLKSNMNMEIYINGKEVSMPLNIYLDKNTQENSVESIQLFNGFYGICSTIMLYKDNYKHNLDNIFPKYLIEDKINNKNKESKSISKYYQNGFFKEELLIEFIKADIKDNVEEKNILDNTIKNLSDQNLNELKDFIKFNLLSIYMPTRSFLNTNPKIKNNESQEINNIILIDSVNNLNAYLNNPNLYNNSIFSRNGGVHILSNILQDFSIDIGGINHLLPLIEVMTDYNELLTKDNFDKYMNIILNLFSNYKKLVVDDANSKFFYYLSLFLEKIPEQFYTDLALKIKLLILTLVSLESDNYYKDDDENIKIYTKDFLNNICLNEKILFKFNSDDKKLIYDQIYNNYYKRNSEQKRVIDINIIKIINILLYHQKDKYTYFCCKKHSEYFNKKTKIMKPELNEYINPLMKIIKLLINQFVLDFNVIEFTQNSESFEQLIKLYELLTFDIMPCLQLSILSLFFEFINSHEQKYYDYLNKNNNINIITAFVYKTSLFDVKELAFKFLINLTFKKENKNHYLEQYIEKYATYYYYYFPNKKEKQNKNIKKEIQINYINYNLVEYSESQKQLLSFCDKKHFNDLMDKIYENAEYYFKNNICASTNLNILISISSKGNINYIIKLLNLIENEIKKNSNNIHIIYNNEKILQWLLDTCYLSYLMKKSIINKDEFISPFSFSELNNDKEKEQILDQIISLSSNILLNIFINNIYKLDYLLTWSRYYCEINEHKNGFISNRKFIFEFFIEKIINKFIDETSNIYTKNENINFKNKLYLANIIFEYIYFHRLKGFTSVDLESLYNQVTISFIYILLNELRKKTKVEEVNINFLKEKWEEYLSINKILGDWKFFLFERGNIPFNNEKKIYEEFIKGKQNKYIKELKILFNNDKNYDIFENNNDLCNKGMELIIIKYHYYTLILTAITNHNEFKEILNEISSFILLIIISSTTLSIDNPKKPNNNINQNKIWPTEEDYKNIQEMVNIILYNFFSILNDKINEMTNNLKKYENKSDSESKKYYKNFYLIKAYLIFILFFFYKLLNRIYIDGKKENDKTKLGSRHINKFLNKIKNYMGNDKESLQLTGGYIFMKDFINNCIEKENEFDELENELNSNNDDFTIIEVKKSFLEDIPNLSLDDMYENNYENSSLNIKLENLYLNNLEYNEKIKNYFSNKEKYQRKLFPFIKYILNRNASISNIIPIYDISIYTSSDYNFLCLEPNYLPKLSNVYMKMENIQKFNNDLVDDIKMYQLELDFNEHDKIRKYRKIKKQLFSFNGIFSCKKYLYEKNKYICKYKLLNHMTEDFTKILLTPIIDINYYLPKFSQFKINNLFRSENQDHLIQITKISNLSLKEPKKEENKKETKIDISDMNILYLIKETEFKDMNDLNLPNEGTLNHYYLFKNYIVKKHQISDSPNNSIENSCFVKSFCHIRGFFYNNEEGIGFYSYDKIPYNNAKISKENNEKNDIINEIQKDYDACRKACFGSVFSPEIEKYEYLHFQIPYNQIIFILKRRYYFKVSALEIYTTDKRSYLFKFDHNKLNDVIYHLKNYLNQKLEDIVIENDKFYNKIGFINLNSKENNINKKIYDRNYMNLKNIYEKWRKWEFSTMRLLMYINIYANRSYNDINQYPVFPWIIIDYCSEKLPKINSNELIRPLDTPMGMLKINKESEERRQNFIENWEISRDDPDREDDKFDRYGSHYSTALYVTYYLFRIFPFAFIKIELQGDSFDDPNRLFNSMEISFECASTQKSDLRELIPELFCFPEILINNNDFNLGEIKERNNNSKEMILKKIEECVTPKWCKNNPYLFIKKHRELLESYEVSNKINEWINLFFGSKQKGNAANEVKNLYNSITYEDYEKIYDNKSQEEKDIACRMLEFGITPHQIFKYGLSQRKRDLESKIKKQLFYNTLENIKQNNLNNIELKNYLNFEDINGDINFNYAKNIYYFPKDRNSKDYKKKYIYIMNNNNIDIYLRNVDRELVRKELKYEPMQILIDSNNEEKEENDTFDDDKKVKIVDKKESIELNKFKYGINDNQPIVLLDKGSIIVQGGYWNGNIILKNIIKEKEKEKPNNINNINYNEESQKTYIYTTSEYSPIIKIIIDSNETFAICGNTKGTIYIYKINSNNKLIWTLYKYFNDHNSPITSIAIHENLNIAITCSIEGLCMLYTLPNFKLYNSFIIGNNKKDNKNKEEILCPNIVLISDKPLPCFIFYVDLKKSIYFYSINGEFLKKAGLDFSIKENTINIYTDYQFVDYLIIYNFKKNTFDLYDIIDFNLICRSPTLPKGNFIDYILSKEMDHILILCKNDNYKYRLYILEDCENQIIWK